MLLIIVPVGRDVEMKFLNSLGCWVDEVLWRHRLSWIPSPCGRLWPRWTWLDEVADLCEAAAWFRESDLSSTASTEKLGYWVKAGNGWILMLAPPNFGGFLVWGCLGWCFGSLHSWFLILEFNNVTKCWSQVVRRPLHTCWVSIRNEVYSRAQEWSYKPSKENRAACGVAARGEELEDPEDWAASEWGDAQSLGFEKKQKTPRTFTGRARKGGELYLKSLLVHWYLNRHLEFNWCLCLIFFVCVVAVYAVARPPPYICSYICGSSIGFLQEDSFKEAGFSGSRFILGKENVVNRFMGLQIWGCWWASFLFKAFLFLFVCLDLGLCAHLISEFVRFTRFPFISQSGLPCIQFVVGPI